jgi:hypothetical protein
MLSMDVREALSQISEIRQQMARSEIFRGYRSIPVAMTGVVGIVAACLQTSFVTEPAQHLDRYLLFWIAIAGIGIALPAVQLVRRVCLAGPGVSRELARLAVEQFTPCILVGALVTLCLYHGPVESLWILPGLWAFFFAMGIFSSCRLLPPQVVWVGLYYLLCGCYCLIHGHSAQAFAPWQMGISFGGGHLLTAAILYWTLERQHDTSIQ